MFLAWREIKESPTKFALMVAVIALMSYLTFFLASLAFGLAHSYRAAIDDWQAQSIALSSTANTNVLASNLDEKQQTDLLNQPDSEPLAARAVVVDGLQDEQLDAFIFGIRPDGFLLPKAIDGQKPSGNGVVVDESFKTQGWKIGDELTISTDSNAWIIEGFAKEQTFQAAPLIYADINSLESPTVNAVVSTSLLTTDGTDIAIVSPEELIQALPGYQAQVLTFTLMIGSLIVIASFVLGIFIYVMTLQKRSMLGILKARGIPTRYLVWSGAAQATMLSVTGVAVGLILTLLSGLALPDKVPFRIDTVVDIAITVGFIVFAVVGGLFSVRVVSKIDPVEAIS